MATTTTTATSNALKKFKGVNDSTLLKIAEELLVKISSYLKANSLSRNVSSSLSDHFLIRYCSCKISIIFTII